MAARLRVRHQDEIREKIKTSQLVNRLENHIFGEIELSSTQIRGIEILLNKTLPNLQATELSGDADNPLTIQAIERKIVKAND